LVDQILPMTFASNILLSSGPFYFAAGKPLPQGHNAMPMFEDVWKQV